MIRSICWLVAIGALFCAGSVLLRYESGLFTWLLALAWALVSLLSAEKAVVS